MSARPKRTQKTTAVRCQTVLFGTARIGRIGSFSCILWAISRETWCEAVENKFFWSCYPVSPIKSRYESSCKGACPGQSRVCEPVASEADGEMVSGIGFGDGSYIAAKL